MRARPERALVALLAVWVLLVLVLFAAGVSHTRLSVAPWPAREARVWALARLEEGRDAPPPGSASSYVAAAPVVVCAHHRGRIVARHEGSPRFVEAIASAASAFAREELPAGTRFSIVVPLARGPVPLGVPWLEPFGVVPLVDGIRARLGEREVSMVPDELLLADLTHGGFVLPLPETSIGVPMDRILARLASALGTSPETLRARGTVERFRAATISRDAYPRETRVDEARLREAALDAARFLERHQDARGRYTYQYDARTDGSITALGYNLPRHGGATYFLAQVARITGDQGARRAALAALGWLASHVTASCGPEARLCVRDSGGPGDAGATALAALAAAEVLAGGPDELAERLVDGYTDFLRSQQRPDGELMHEYDFVAQRPIDVQHMYYSGEAAYALLRAHAVRHDPRDLEAARKLLRHLATTGWDFAGSRYVYGEEHWTCIAGAEGRTRVDLPELRDFCRRWFEWNEAIQFRRGETPWQAEGAYGFGPFVVPRLTPVGSRGEAFIGTYELLGGHGRAPRGLRQHIERSLAQLLRYRFAPGPRRLLADPARAHGGIPGGPIDLTVRNDFVQHAGAAFIRWVEVLERERGAR